MLGATSIRRNQQGFTLIELMLVVGIMGMLLALAFPDYEVWLENIQSRNSAEGIQNGLRLARAEAARRNGNVDFVLTTQKPNNDSVANVSVAGNIKGTNWIIRANDGSGTYRIADYVQSQLSSEGSARVSVTSDGGGIYTFTGLGNTTSAADRTINIANPKGDRPLRITISRAGQIRMCDPSSALKATDPRRC